MLPKKMLEKIAPKAKKILENKENEFDHEFEGIPLVGVFNIETNNIFLYPCLKERVWIQVDEITGEVKKAWQQEKDWWGNLIQGVEIKDEKKIASYNDTVFAPRAISIGQASPEDKISSHLFVLNLIDEVKNKKNYRGFSIIPSKGEPGTFDYIFESASLNKTSIVGSKIMDKKCQKVVIETLKERFPPSKLSASVNDNFFFDSEKGGIELKDIAKFKKLNKS